MAHHWGRILAGTALSLSVLAAATACDADTGRPAAAPTTPGHAPPPLAEVKVDLGLPEGYAPVSVEFADAWHGYALFVRCGTLCDARLFHTADGGRTWRPREHPRPEAKNHQLYSGGGHVVVLLAEPHSWYVSRDAGASWQPRPYDARGRTPVEYHSANGTYYLDCPESGGRCAVRDWTAGTGWRRDVPAELAAARSLTNGRDGRIWLSGVDGGRIVTAVGSAGGGFTRLPVPDQPGRAVWNARVVTSADGRDIWLVAGQEQADAAAAPARLAPARLAPARLAPARLAPVGLVASARKGTGLPLLWRFEAGAWVPYPIRGIEEKANWPYSVAPAGGGLLVLAGPELTGYLDGGAYSPAPGAPRLDWVGQLPDGTLFGRDNRPGVTYLSPGTGPARTWSTVEVSA
ncbi:hypothetical protein ACTMTJ_28725 [Phytohabitans sp. LJ34]|uniref:hypothetical protein n=1 Tax=Phytohabitans sp. LJ34 TaxID=3452217 RepID=UPI003F8A6E4F